MAANSDVLLFLHGDTRLPGGFDKHVLESFDHARRSLLELSRWVSMAQRSGCGFVEKLANFRSRVFQMPYGDQAIFLRANLFRSIGGFPEIPIMEDFVFMERLKKEGRVVIAPIAVTTAHPDAGKSSEF